jgi:hypothetical protein
VAWWVRCCWQSQRGMSRLRFRFRILRLPSVQILMAPAELPREFLKISLNNTPAGGKTWTVHDAQNLQRTLSNVSSGDTIQLDAGITFTGKFEVPNKHCEDAHWIIIRTSASDSELPAGLYQVWSTGGGKVNCAFFDKPITTFNACFRPIPSPKMPLIDAPTAFPAGSWPAGNFFPPAHDTKLVNYNGGNGGDYHLYPSSRYKHAGNGWEGSWRRSGGSPICD